MAGRKRKTVSVPDGKQEPKYLYCPHCGKWQHVYYRGDYVRQRRTGACYECSIILIRDGKVL